MSGYVSKDFIHLGCGLILDSKKVLEIMPHSLKWGIRKAEKNNIIVEKVNGTKEDIEILKSMWYDPADPNLPDKLKENEFMFIAYNSLKKPIGAIILLPVSNHLFLNNLAGNEEGKALRVQDFLLWKCVNYFENSKFKYIDVGVSYRQTLYEFFKKWQTFEYPVIFNVPKIKLNIGLEPFNENYYNSEQNSEKVNLCKELLNKTLNGRKYTFVPDIEQVEIIIKRLGLEFYDRTFNFTDKSIKTPFAVDLSKIFSVQFGALLVNVELDDKALFNDHRAADYYKRELVFSNIFYELEEMDVLTAYRKRNIDILEHYFNLEDIKSIRKKEIIPSAFYFISEFNLSYHKKLNDFGINHYFDSETLEIGLPVHQNLNKHHLEYMYGIFRGVLNLCSEWIHTDVYFDIK